MNDEKKKEKGGGSKPIGSISQQSEYASFGNPDSQIANNQENQLTGLSERQMAESQDKQMVSYLKEKKPERKAQIAYLPPGLIKKLKKFAFDHDLEISMVVQVAIQEFLEKQEK